MSSLELNKQASCTSAGASSSNDKSEEMKRRGLELLKSTHETVHIISTPFDSEDGRSLNNENNNKQV